MKDSDMRPEIYNVLQHLGHFAIVHDLGFPTPLYKRFREVTTPRVFSTKNPTSPNLDRGFLSGDKIRSANLSYYCEPLSHK